MKTNTLKLANNAFLKGDLDDAIKLYSSYLKTTCSPLRRSVFFCKEYGLKRLAEKNNYSKNINTDFLKSRLDLFSDAEQVRKYFDAEYYLAKNIDVARSGIDPVEHYCEFGWRQNRDPHPEFSTTGYLSANPDVAESGHNPFIHWITYGKDEGRDGNPKISTFDSYPISKNGIFLTSCNRLTVIDPVDIVIPIYNAFDDVIECLGRVLKYTSVHHRVILINDASTDRRINNICDDFISKRQNSVLKVNDSNLGFIASVNYGFSLSKGHVILLNTDAFVPENWMERLIAPILADESIASVTPMSNNAEIANIPIISKPSILERGVADKLDKFASQLNHDITSTEVPTGVGFCMAISFHWLKRIPTFDPVFGRGYGEEVDWCQRVRKIGGKHILTSSLFVEHRGGMSFGDEKSMRIIENNKIISTRYPLYDYDVQQFIKSDQAIGPRIAITLKLISSEGCVPILFGHRLGGGAEIWLMDYIEIHKSNNKSTIVLRDGDCDGRILIEVHTVYGVLRGNVLIEELENYLSILDSKEFIYSCLVSSVDPLGIINRALSAMTSKDIFRVLFHDYYPVCPSYTLIGHDQKYCGIPEISRCEDCYSQIRFKTGSKSKSISEWRSEWKKIINNASEIVVFSEYSKYIISNVWPEFIDIISLKPHVINNLPPKTNKKLKENKTFVLGVLGSIGFQKGAKILKDMAKINDKRIKIVVIGQIDPEFSDQNIFIHGQYQKDQISNLVEKYSIDSWLLPSIWPETFSYTTRECLATGLPVYVFDIGGQAEGVRNAGYDTLLNLDMTPSEIINRILQGNSNHKH